MLNKEDIMPVIERALIEDVGDGDITTKWTVPLTKQAKAKLTASFWSRAWAVDRRARCVEFFATHVGYCDDDGTVCRGGAGDTDADSRYAQDRAGIAIIG